MKKYLSYFLFFTCFLLLCSKNTAAQSGSAINIWDLNLGLDYDTTLISSHQVKLIIDFKVSDVTQVDSAFFLLGTTWGGAEIKKETGKFTHSGASYSITTQGLSYAIPTAEVSCKIIITEAEYNASPYFALVLKDNVILYTNTLKTQK